MKNVILVDITTMNKSNIILGHFVQVSKNYIQLLKDDFNIYIAGGKSYRNYIQEDNLIVLPYENSVSSQNTILGRAIKKLKEFKNICNVFKYKYDVVILQSYSNLLPLLTYLLLFGRVKSDIYVIQYRNGLKNRFIRYLYRIVCRKIKGIICTNDNVGNLYNKPYINITDYVYTGDIENMRYTTKFKYDFGFVGNISSGKDIEEIVNTFKGTNYKVIIAGSFEDKQRYKKLLDNCTDNIKIIDEFISREKYFKYINESKYIVLPYKEYYNTASSGVVYDALFNFRPVIAKRLKTFEFIKKENIGFLYDKSIKEFLEDGHNYRTYINNLKSFLIKNKSQKEKLVKFLS